MRQWSKWEIMKQILVQFGDIKPFLIKNTDIGPTTRPKLIAFLRIRKGAKIFEDRVSLQ